MHKIGPIVMTLALAVGSTLVFSAASEAKPRGADLAVTGSPAGGETTIETDHLAAFVFTQRNRGPLATGDSADLVLTHVRGGTIVDINCIQPNRHSMTPDGTFCETGALAKGESARAVYVIRPSTPGALLSVTACAMNEGPVPDPVAANNCKTVTLAVFGP